MTNVITTRRLTTKDLEVVFGVSSMSLFLWRKGTPTKTKLPTVKPKAGDRGVQYDADAVLKWAEKNGVPVAKHPSKLKAASASKPGPKARMRPLAPRKSNPVRAAVAA